MLNYLPEIKCDLKIPDIAGSTADRRKSKHYVEKVSKVVPNWSRLREYNISPPVLFMNEANYLSCLLLQDEKGSSVLIDFFAWIVANSKQRN